MIYVDIVRNYVSGIYQTGFIMYIFIRSIVKYHLIKVGVNFNLDLIERLLVRLVFFNHCVADVETGTKGEFQLYIHI